MKSKHVSNSKTNKKLEGELLLTPEELLIKLKQRETELSLINSVQQAIMAEMDLQEIYDLVGDEIRELFNAQVVGIYTIDIDKNMEYFHYLYEDGARIFPKPRELDKVRQLLVETKELILINENFPQKIANIIGVQPKAVPGTKLPKSILFVPMVIRGDVRGYVSLQNLDKEHAFNDTEVRLLSTLTNSMSSALENARLFNETEQNNAELAVINSVQEGLAAEMDMQGIYEIVGDRLRDLFDAQVASIATFNYKNNTEEFQYFFEDVKHFNLEPRAIDKVRQLIIDTQELLCINQNADEIWTKITGEEPTVIPGTKLTKSILYVPMTVGNEVRGYVSLQNLDREHAFSDSDIRLLSTLTNSMSVALENARLFNETEERNAELAVINSIQEGLVAEMDMQGIYDLVGDKIQHLFDAQVVAVSTFDHENKKENFKYLYENGQKPEAGSRGIDKIREKLITSKKLIDIKQDTKQAYIDITGNPPKSVPGTEYPKSMVFIPMLIGDTVRGYVSLQNLDREHAFSDSNISLLSTLTNSMSVALENARLFSETEQRNAELAVINSVQEGLVAEMDMQGIYDLVGEKIRNLFDAQVTGIYSFDHESELEYFQYLHEDGERLHPDPRPFTLIRQWIIKNKKMLLFNENANENIFKVTGEGDVVVPGTRLPKSLVFVPLIVGDEVKGCVSLQNLDRENAFSDSDVRLLSTLSNSMSVALENARLFNETEQRNAELAVINSVQEGLVAEMDMQGIYDLVGEKIRNLFDAQVTGIYSFNHDSKMEDFHYLFEDGARLYPKPRPLNQIRKWIIENASLLLVNEDADNVIYNITGEKHVAVPGTRLPKSMLFVPLIVGSIVKGCVSLQNLDREHAFSDSDVRLLSTLANSMSVALENARLFNETEQRNAELAVINSVQEGLVAEMDMQGIYDLVGDKIRDLFDAQVTGIVTLDSKKETERWQYIFEDGKRYFPDDRKIDLLRKKVITERKALLLSENAAQTISEINGKPHQPVPGTKAAKSAIFVPMLVGDVPLGYVTLQNTDRNNAFSDSDVSLLNTLVNSMTVALENARLFNETTRLLAETEQRNAEFAVINSVQEGLVREMDMKAIYHLVGSRICEVVNTQTLIIRTFDHDTGLEHWDYAVENEEQLVSEPRPLIWANKNLIKTKESLLINENYVETAEKYGDTRKGVSEGLPPKSAIFVPMLVGDIVKGSVSLQNVEEENAFTESDVRLLSTLTNSMSVALENARLFNETTRLLGETEQRASELQTVNSISKAMVSHLEFDSLVKMVGDQMLKTFKADIVYLALHDRKTNMLHFPYIHGETAESRPFANGITENIILEKEPLLINQNMDEAYTKIKADVKGQMVQSFLGVPIITGSDAIGVISIQSTELKNRFNEYDQRLLTTIAANLGIAIQNAEAYQKLQAALTELKAAQQQLVQSEKMASLGELTAGIAHEIQNPLNFVNNFSEVSGELLEELEDDIKPKPDSDINDIITDLKQNLDKINHHGKRASSIVKGMLDHSRTSSGTKELTDINVLADEYLRLAYHGLRAKDRSFNASFKTYLDENLPKTDVIPQDFGRVILNLINNAFYAVSRKEKVAPDDYVPTVSVSTKSVDGVIEIEVKDNGEGISKDISDKIFQPFFTTKPSGEGTGLGLSLAYDIVTKGHGGQLIVDSKKGSYTKFKILLPIKTK
ncbi:MAG: GAF domain-containing protein [Psychroserpens sp.]|uniref:GAF domain-containing protein n=1 Tax=Psychroserpens sp. TaxID=2020870 RepID=UPI003001F4DA